MIAAVLFVWVGYLIHAPLLYFILAWINCAYWVLRILTSVVTALAKQIAKEQLRQKKKEDLLDGERTNANS